MEWIVAESEIQIVSRPCGLVSYGVMKKFEDLTEREVLALAIALEEEDERVYSDFAEGLRQDYPATASMFDGMREEESGHRRRLLELFQKKFGEHIPLIRRQDVRGFVERPALWLVRPLRIEAVRKEASTMEVETRRFYEKAAVRTQDASIRQLLDDLAREEREHEERAQELDKQKLPDNVKADEEVAQRRLFVLQIVQPGLAGLMDGSVSTLAPVFAAAFATTNSWTAFRVGLAASAGAGISMGFAEALSDDGSLTGRGHPWVRGVICGAMTALGGIGHTMPFLLSNFRMAVWAASVVVVAELALITWIRHRYMDSLRRFDELHFAFPGAVEDHQFAFGVAEDEDIAVAEVGFLDGFFEGHGTHGYGFARADQVDFGGFGDRRVAMHGYRDGGFFSQADGGLNAGAID
jgi:erythrin-vacuolar iron transport family protein